MNLRAFVVIALVNLGFLSVGDGSATGLGLLMPLLPLATITGHGGLFYSGLTAAGLLKLKAAAALSHLFKKGGIDFDLGWTNDDHQHHHHDHHNHHDNHHNGWHRRRRAATEADARGDTADLSDQTYDPTLDEVLEYDQLGCGMRLVCELSASPYDNLQDDEKLIIELFGRDETAPNPAKASRGKLSYSYAALLGANSQNISSCARVYASCPHSAQQTMQALRDAKV